MTILFLESFDGYSTIAELAGVAANAVGFKWYDANNTPSARWLFDAGGESGQQIQYNGTAAGNAEPHLIHQLPAQATTFAMGAKYIPPVVSGTSDTPFMGLENNPNSNDFWVGRHGSEISCGSNGVRRALSSGLGLVAGTRNAVEAKCVFVSGSTWTVTVKVNGVAVIGPSNLVLQASNWGYVYLGCSSGQGLGPDTNLILESIYVDDTDFIPGAGAWKVRIARPSGAGAHTDWIPSSGANYAAINEQNVDDTSYVQGTNDGDEDTYAYDDIAFTSGYAVRAVQVCTRGAYTAGAKHLAHMARLAGVEEQGASIALSASLAHNATVMPLDPNGAVWTPTTFNAAEFGQKQLS